MTTIKTLDTAYL